MFNPQTRLRAPTPSGVAYGWHINGLTVREVHARAFYTCEKCGRDIIVGDLHYHYKPLPRIIRGQVRADRWRRRCLDCPPVSYDEAERYERP